ncbi:hypothetical protein [Spirulina sp. 06S082]|uniref:hypothetical protein n=1 Tax=Spirulina sp. 06S082 TaxID=3110248 RepID=UPI002B202E47|nr:hypothetical protein [Spirulina sp. 06S082]MEA5470680.1 hypothetical protein [Spirulina sp. 06S082]
MKSKLQKIGDGLKERQDRLLKILNISNSSLNWPIFWAFLVSLLSLPLWYWTFEQSFPVEVRLSAPGVEIVRVYWDNPETHSDAYEAIAVKPVESKKWDLKIEALGEKNPDSDGFEVAILDIKTPQGQVDWSQGEFSGGKWEFRPDPNGPQGKVAIAHSNQPEYGKHPGQLQSFAMALEGGDIEVLLLSHTGSGKVRIMANNLVRELDLHNYGLNYEKVVFLAGEAGDRMVRNYQFEIPDTWWHKLKFIGDGNNKVNIEEIKVRNTIVSANENGEYIISFWMDKRILISIIASLITFVCVAAIAIGFSQDIKIILGFTLIQGIWLTLFFSVQVGILNTLPNLVLLSIWYFFTRIYYPQKRFWLVFTPVFLLTLKLPLTLGRTLEIVNWLIYFLIIYLVFKKIFAHFQIKKNATLLLATLIIIWFNAFAHISYDSPYTYVNRSINFYWECPHETYLFMVNCDHGHYLAEEFIFTTDEYDASFSVLLRRFFYGYLSSLIGFSGHRWVASFTLNLLFWMFSCVALYQICILTKLGERIASIAMFCGASSWGFITFVGQPAMYMVAYAYAAITVWATLEILAVKSRRKIALLSLIILSGTLVYDIYPITVSSFLILLFYKRRISALSILIGQLALSFVWKNFYLTKILGTIGDQSNVSLATDSLKIWVDIIKNLDFSQGLHWIIRGTHSFIYGNMIFGAIAGFIFIIFLSVKWRQNKQNQEEKILLLFSFLIYILVWMATVATIPKASEWGIGGMLPRLAFYSYPVGTIALAFFGSRFLGKAAYIIPVLTFMVANIDTFTGLASIAVFFDYGTIDRLYWR